MSSRIPFAVACGVGLLGTSGLAAQRGRPVQEFTRQELLVSNFEIDSGASLRAARRLADAIRSRLSKAVNDREVRIISGTDLRFQLTFASFAPDSAVSRRELRLLGAELRADEVIVGTLTPSAKGMQLVSQLVLMRDERFVQPLPVVAGSEPDALAAQLVPSIVALRRQIPYERRCENALRERRGADALRSAREGAAAVPGGTLVRICLVIALRQTRAPAPEVLQEARAVLSLDPHSVHAIEAAAIALDSLGRIDEAGAMWLRLAATDTANLDLTERVVWALAFGGNSRVAEPLIVRASTAHPDDLRLLRQRWIVQYDIRNWPGAIEAAELLLPRDETAFTDSTFLLKLATAYRANGQPFKAVEIASRGVSRFPSSARLYALYTQLVRAEADTAIPRGLGRFPRSAELLALNAQALRLSGRVAEALEASRLAVSIDSTLPQAELMIAQAEIELGRPDSALVSLHRALARGEDSTLVAQFVLAKGNGLLRAAHGTKSRDDFQRATRYLAFADSIRPSQQAKFLIGTAAFSVAQSALSEAPAAIEKTVSCDLARLGAESLRVALSSLEAGQEVAPDAARQYLEYLGTLQPYVDQQLRVFCESIGP